VARDHMIQLWTLGGYSWLSKGPPTVSTQTVVCPAAFSPHADTLGSTALTAAWIPSKRSSIVIGVFARMCYCRYLHTKKYIWVRWAIEEDSNQLSISSTPSWIIRLQTLSHIFATACCRIFVLKLQFIRHS